MKLEFFNLWDITAWYIAYHTWLIRNKEVSWQLVKFILERVAQAPKIVHPLSSGSILLTCSIQDSSSTYAANRLVFITRDPLFLRFFKVNFNGSVRGNKDGVGSVIHEIYLRFMVAYRSHLFNNIILGVELTPRANYLVVEENSSTMIDWM